MAVSPTESHSTARSAPAVPPLQGKQARLVAQSQGEVWAGIIGATTIGEHVETGEAIDARGDAIRATIWRLVTQAAGRARRDRQYEIHNLLVEVLGLIPHYEACEEAEDWHRRETGRQADAELSSLGVSNTIHGLLLGQAEADVPADTVHAIAHGWPDGLGPGRCGKQRPAERPSVGNGLTTAPCELIAGHEAESPCLFVVMPQVGATP